MSLPFALKFSWSNGEKFGRVKVVPDSERYSDPIRSFDLKLAPPAPNVLSTKQTLVLSSNLKKTSLVSSILKNALTFESGVCGGAMCCFTFEK